MTVLLAHVTGLQTPRAAAQVRIAELEDEHPPQPSAKPTAHAYAAMQTAPGLQEHSARARVRKHNETPLLWSVNGSIWSLLSDLYIIDIGVIELNFE